MLLQRLALLVSGLALLAWTPLAADTRSAKAKPGNPNEALLQAGLDKLAKGHLKEAEEAFRAALCGNPSLAGALVGLAQVELQTGRAALAETHMVQAVAAAPRSAAVRRSQGRLLLARGHLKQAEAAFTRAIALEPGSPLAYKELSDLYLLAMQEPRRAVETSRQGIAASPSSAELRLALGTGLSVLGQWDEAEAAFREAARLAPGEPAPLHSLGQLHSDRGQTQKALGALEAALKIRPDYLPARLSRGDVFMRAGDDGKAIAEYQLALKTAPSLAEAQIRIGLVHQAKNRTAAAEQAFQAALALDPNRAVAHNNLAYLAASRKANLDQALAGARKAVALEPKNAAFHDTLGWVRLARGEADAAIAALEQSVALDSTQGEALYHLGIAYSLKGRNSDARAAFNRALAAKQPFPGLEDARRRAAEGSRR